MAAMASLGGRHMRVAVAMSGGVDSSVAAMLLREQGHDVFGVHLRVFDRDDGPAAPDGSAQANAVRVAEALAIELRVLDVRDIFREQVVQPFIDEYLRGRTPNPCVLCNPAIKLGALFERAREWGAEALATGHYARVRQNGGLENPPSVSATAGGHSCPPSASSTPDASAAGLADPARHWLRRGLSAGKDQSYYLSLLRQEQLARFLTPVGELDKGAVRRLARARALPVADAGESQDICFIPDGDYKRFIERHAAGRLPGAGEIVDLKGVVRGRHQGAWRYTIGQRRGLGVSAPIPLFVVAIDMVNNRVIVGPQKATESRELLATGVNYVSMAPPAGPFRCEVQIRYRRHPSPARVEPIDSGARAPALRVVFDEPQSAISPGQTAVFYDGEIVLAGGWIA